MINEWSLKNIFFAEYSTASVFMYQNWNYRFTLQFTDDW